MADHRSRRAAPLRFLLALASELLASPQPEPLQGAWAAELVDVLRRRTQRGQGRGPGRGGRGRGRGDTSEEDEDLGLPRSPCNSPSDNPLPLPK
ncbi:S-ribosylhomocysteine lyase, partial [Frankliniella fusca]